MNSLPYDIKIKMNTKLPAGYSYGHPGFPGQGAEHVAIIRISDRPLSRRDYCIALTTMTDPPCTEADIDAAIARSTRRRAA